MSLILCHYSSVTVTCTHNNQYRARTGVGRDNRIITPDLRLTAQLTRPPFQEQQRGVLVEGLP
jgi:hypothetical protein